MLQAIQGEALSPDTYLALFEQPDPAFDRYLADDIYARGDPGYIAEQKKRFAATIEAHRRRFGDAPCLLLRVPGRLNAFLEYLDMCAGDHMSTTIDGDTPMVMSVREDDTVEVHNTSALFEDRLFSIGAELAQFKGAPWGAGETAGLEDNWDVRTRVYPYHGRRKGDHANYVVASYLRFAWDNPGTTLRGANLTFGPSTCPLRAGVSSSSGVVVLSALACLRANTDRLPAMTMPELCSFLGEAEWYVGTHGGANDQTTILRNEPRSILYNRHSRDALDSTPLPFLHGLSIVMANSLWEANKALGANYVFNLRKGWMDLGNDLLERVIACLADGASFPELFPWTCDRGALPLLDDIAWDQVKERYRLFGSLDESLLGIPQAAIEQLIQLLPGEIDPQQAEAVLGKDRTALARDYTMPDDTDRVWRPRNAATFFNRENVLGRSIEKLLLEADAALASGVSAESAEYERFRSRLGTYIEDVQETIRDDFAVSNDQLDLLLSIAKDGPGHVAGKLTGAGSGGCVCIFVREDHAQGMCGHLDKAYYGVSSNFDRYREELSAIEDEAPRREMERNLAEALSDMAAQRRIVSFSRGAGVITGRGDTTRT